MTSLKGAFAIVTGGSSESGYGAGIAKALVECGARVWITGRNAEKLNKVAGEIGAEAIAADVTSPSDWDRVMSEVLRVSNGRLDILVNNAGAAIAVKPMTAQTDGDMERCIAINLTGAMFGCARAAKVMTSQKSGTIVNISSVCDRHAWPGFGPYSAAKAGLVQLGKVMYTELRPHGVKVTTLTPSWGATGFASAAGLGGREPEVSKLMIAPAEIGKLVVQICELPPHLAIDEVVLRPLVQEIIPL